eukprot:TRINITY_DN6179_c0_g1_i1.p1 TRINITY_DN6179_c0_g1~~TRINITY_DN6179_c0_g1_i1.p1  ORF type:complete len:647 (+),score=170.65 TRINITY_DN6179_c0_g1_i1:62-1942(+)
MSRLLKKLHGNDLLGGRASESEEDGVTGPSMIKATSQNRKNEKKKQKKAREGNEPEVAAKHVNTQPTRQSKKKKKKQQVKEEVKESSESEDIDAILMEHTKKLNKGKNKKELAKEERVNSELAKLMTCTGGALNPDEELKKMFGTAAIAHERREANADNRRQRNRQHGYGPQAPKKALRFRETLLAKPDQDTWPRYQNHGYSMTSTGGEMPKWHLVESDDCLKAASLLKQAVNSMRLQAFDALLYKYPYYIPTLLKYNEIVCQMGEFSEGAAMIDQALYTASLSAPPDFSWTAPFSVRSMPFEGANKDLFLTIQVKVQSMIKRGCHRTALEWLKMLFNFNENDPCHALLLLDYCAVKSGQWQWFMDLQKEMAEHREWMQHTSKIPCFKFGVALSAKFNKDARADRLLTDAVRWYPHAVPQIINAVKAMGETGAEELLTTTLPDQAPTVEGLVNLYVTRSAELWGGPTIKWLIGIALKVKNAHEDGSLVPVAELPALARSAAFVHHAQCDASAHMGRVEVLPQEAFEEGENEGVEGIEGAGAEIPQELLDMMRRLQEGGMAEGLVGDEDADGDEVFEDHGMDSEAMQMLAVAESEIMTLQDDLVKYLEAPASADKMRINEMVCPQRM